MHFPRILFRRGQLRHPLERQRPAIHELIRDIRAFQHHLQSVERFELAVHAGDVDALHVFEVEYQLHAGLRAELVQPDGCDTRIDIEEEFFRGAAYCARSDDPRHA